MIGEERRKQIMARVTPLLQAIDPELRLLELLLDSTRQQLAFVLQKGDLPLVVGMNWLDYVSHRDEELQARLREGIAKRLEISQKRQGLEEP